MKRSVMFWLAIFASVLLLVFKFFEWQLVGLFTVFFLPVIWLVFYGFFIVAGVLSIVQWVRKKDWKPVTVIAVTTLLVFLIPFHQLAIQTDFYWNKQKRLEVIEQIDNQTLEPNVSHNDTLIELPTKYRSLSSGGDVVLEKQSDRLSVLFFTSRGVLDNFSGFVYSENGEEPDRRDFGGDFKEIVPMGEKWFFVSSS
ncbi:hypothetical protein [Aquibacillus sediminis]|uniref:hypothetical protein n=1 Tax=Aquibacillus sediminis TaxID=2574734 RepID=UPI001108F0F4|nr:hypothetical protein [Aquibacillus sediminis]